MGNGTEPTTDREWLMRISRDQKNFSTECFRRLDNIDDKLKNHGRRISETEKDVIKIRGEKNVQDEKIETLEQDSPAKAVKFWGVLISLILAGAGLLIYFKG